MTDFKIKYGILAFLLFVVFSACRKDAWNDHNKNHTQDLSRNLFQQISATPELSKFTEYLIASGYDSVLSSSRSFTVWAPDNKALESLDPAIVNDVDQLKKFVANHISYQSYFTDMTTPSGIIIKALNTKNVSFTSSAFEGGEIKSANRFVSNGVLHVIENYAIPKQNAWEFAQSSDLGDLQRKYISTLFHIELDTSKGVKLYNDPITKKPVYQEGTTFAVTKNYFFQQVSDIRSEDSLMTYFILTDEAFIAEKAKLEKYFQYRDADTAASLTQWSVVKDLVVNGVYSQSQLGQPMQSVNGVTITVNPADVVETKQLSNGVAYVIKNINYEILSNKIPSVIIEGESPFFYKLPRDPSFKIKTSPDGSRFTDVQVSSITSSPDPLYHFAYRTLLNSVKYKVYWRAVNDIYTSAVSMKIDFGKEPEYSELNDPPLPTVGYHSVPFLADRNDPSFYQEVYLGEYTSEQYGTVYAFLASALGVTSGAPSALTLDYIKLEPVN